MSKKEAAEFLKKVNSDKAAAKKLEAAYRAALVQAGKDAGFKFTREDLEAALVETKSEMPTGAVQGVAAGRTLPGDRRHQFP